MRNESRRLVSTADPYNGTSRPHPLDPGHRAQHRHARPAGTQTPYPRAPTRQTHQPDHRARYPGPAPDIRPVHPHPDTTYPAEGAPASDECAKTNSANAWRSKGRIQNPAPRDSASSPARRQRHGDRMIAHDRSNDHAPAIQTPKCSTRVVVEHSRQSQTGRSKPPVPPGGEAGGGKYLCRTRLPSTGQSCLYPFLQPPRIAGMLCSRLRAADIAYGWGIPRPSLSRIETSGRLVDLPGCRRSRARRICV